MRISDWSSDVCSSDLAPEIQNMLQRMGADDRVKRFVGERQPLDVRLVEADALGALAGFGIDDEIDARQLHFRPASRQDMQQIGRASWREGVCQDVWISGVGVSLKKKKMIQ